MHLSKRRLATTYLAGTGSVLSLVLLVRGLASAPSLGIRSLVFLSGLLPSLSLATVELWVPLDGLDDEQVWRLAEWGGLGLATVTALALGIVAIRQAPVLDLGEIALAGNIASGGVIGVLYGSVREHARRARRLHEKHAVLNRVLRHDLRNSMGVVRAGIETIESHVPESESDRIDEMLERIDGMVELSWTARTVQETIETRELTAIDVVARVEDRVDQHRAGEVRIETDLPPSAWAYADHLFEVALDHLLRNAVEHATETVRVTVDSGEGDGVKVRIRDDGPGIPERTIERLETVDESPTEHSFGTGLWVVKWLIERYGGSIAFDRTDSGTVARIELEGAVPPEGSASVSIGRFLE